MANYRLRLLIFLLGLLAVLLAASLLYQLGMARLEGIERTFWESLEWAAETLSTTGYGWDEHWESPLMVLFVVGLQFVGVLLVFLVFPVLLIPLLEERFEGRVPEEIKPLEGHVVVFRYSAAVDNLLDELEASGVPTLVLEDDEATARRLMRRGVRVVRARPGVRLARRSHLLKARALVANGPDDENAALTLGARQEGFEGDILALVEQPFHRRAMMLSGATIAYTPRHVLAAALVARASERISPRVSGVQHLGRHLQVREIRVTADSGLVGHTLAESNLGARTRATVIAQWVGGKLIAPAGPEMVVEAGGILVAIGSAKSLRLLKGNCGARSSSSLGGPILIAGYGEVGHKAVELLKEVGEPTRVLDRQAGEGVDVVGDVLDPEVLSRMDIRSSRTAILALDSDSATLFATVILKDLAPELAVIARVNDAENVERIHAAGADFALSISRVSGQILARRLLGEEAISIDPQLKLLQVAGRTLAGRHPAELEMRQKTGCSLVAVERGDDVIVEFGTEFRVAESDTVYVAGSAAATRRFLELFPSDS